MKAIYNKVAMAVLVVFITACGADTVKFGKSEAVPRSPAPGVSQPPAEEELECKVAKDCDDKDKSTIDTCVDGACVHKTVVCPDDLVLNEVGECIKPELACGGLDDSDLCTVDSCDPLSGDAVHMPKSCSDDDETTLDTCDTATGACSHTAECGNCSDDDPCTNDVCDAGVCTNIAVVCPAAHVCVSGTCVFQCTTNDQCGDDNPCTIDACDAAKGECVNELRDCADADKTTTDLCLQEDDGAGKPYTCVHAPSACTGGCDDNDACTVDACVDSACAHFAAPCGVGTVCEAGKCIPAPCQGSSDCDDGNPCTVETCEFGVCEYVSKSCAAGEACDAASGKCLDLETPDCPEGCDDKDEGTLDICADGVCTHHQPVDCGAGTALNPKTGECEPAKADPTCQAGTLACQQFEALNLLAYTVCADGFWFIVQGCGAIKSAKCLGDSGCD